MGQAFLPIIIYYVISNGVVLGGFSVIQMTEDFWGGIEGNIQFYARTFIKMAGMALGGLAVYPYLKKENYYEEAAKLSPLDVVALIFSGAVLSLGVNYIFFITGMIQNSETYQQVAEAQFALPLWLACIFYGILSPVVEETLFRGIVYRALCRNTTKTMGMIGSALLFGAFHGNIVQMMYASLMGGVLAYVYQKYEKLWAPVLFHGAANVAIYLVTVFLSFDV